MMGNLSLVEYSTGNFQNVYNIQIFIYLHRKSQKAKSLDLEQCLHNTSEKNCITSCDLFKPRSVITLFQYLTKDVGNMYHRP